ncbi:radical SAM protein [Patescibacteria group bacterium]
MAVINTFLGPTLQIYTTSKCNMKCAHCASRFQRMPDMSNDVFLDILKHAYNCGIKRIELFGNDPLLHPKIKEQIRMLNDHSYDYAICTVGASPEKKDTERLFWDIVGSIDNRKGGVVFSVDCTEKTAIDVLESDILGVDNSYAFKALTFWRYAGLLKKMGISARTNTVISRYNINDVNKIIRRVVEMGFATSFCFVQHCQMDFENLKDKGLIGELRDKFYEYLLSTNILERQQIDKIIEEAEKIVSAGKLEKGGPFNCFRGFDSSESEVDLLELQTIRTELLNLKNETSGGLVLPNDDFILDVGNKGFGCLELLRQEKYPQMKVDSRGRMTFCCDLHDPLTQTFSIKDFGNTSMREAFLKNILSNPYIWLCCYFNPCDFSVNRVGYDTKLEEVKTDDIPTK